MLAAFLKCSLIASCIAIIDGMWHDAPRRDNSRTNFLQGRLVQTPIGRQQPMLLPGAGQALFQRLAASPAYLASRFNDENVASANVPIVKRRVRVQIDVRLAARHQSQLDASRIRLDDLRWPNGVHPA